MDQAVNLTMDINTWYSTKVHFIHDFAVEVFFLHSYLVKLGTSINKKFPLPPTSARGHLPRTPLFADILLVFLEIYHDFIEIRLLQCNSMLVWKIIV